MELPIEKLDYKVDIDELQEVTIDFLHRYHWDKSNQLCLLNTQDWEPGDPYQGIGHVKEPGYPAFGYKEGDFNVFHPDYEDTILGKLYREFPLPVCRMRVLRVPTKRCYTMHVDGDTHRYHFAVISNKDAFFVFGDQGRIQSIPCDGHAYKVCVKEPHTFVNTNSGFDRIHIVLDAAPKE